MEPVVLRFKATLLDYITTICILALSVALFIERIDSTDRIIWIFTIYLVLLKLLNMLFRNIIKVDDEYVSLPSPYLPIKMFKIEKSKCSLCETKKGDTALKCNFVGRSNMYLIATDKGNISKVMSVF